MMHFTFAQVIGEGSEHANWLLSSRGTDISGHRPICPSVARLLGAQPGGEPFAQRHRSRGIAADTLDDEHLVVVATVAERGTLARLHPAGRARAFTLREATMLGRAEPSATELERARELLTADQVSVLAAYAQLLHQRRGLVSPARSWPARFGSRLLGAGRFDIPDGHHRSGWRHAITLRWVRSETQLLAQQLQRFVAALG